MPACWAHHAAASRPQRILPSGLMLRNPSYNPPLGEIFCGSARPTAPRLDASRGQRRGRNYIKGTERAVSTWQQKPRPCPWLFSVVQVEHLSCLEGTFPGIKYKLGNTRPACLWGASSMQRFANFLYGQTACGACLIIPVPILMWEGAPDPPTLAHSIGLACEVNAGSLPKLLSHPGVYAYGYRYAPTGARFGARRERGRERGRNCVAEAAKRET